MGNYTNAQLGAIIGKYKEENAELRDCNNILKKSLKNIASEVNQYAPGDMIRSLPEIAYTELRKENSHLLSNIGQLKCSMDNLSKENDKLNAEQFNLRSKIDDLLDENIALKREIEQIKLMKTADFNTYSVQIKKLQSQIDLYEIEKNKISREKEQLLIQLQNLSSSFQRIKDENVSLMDQLYNALRNNNQTISKTIWTEEHVLGTLYKNEEEEIVFRLCLHPNQKYYMDARVYRNGRLTKKGICLEPDQFDLFLRKGRSCWAKAESKLY